MNNLYGLDVQVYGKFQAVSPVMSQASVRLFYLGLNRNYTFFTQEFADKLLSSLPYTPIVGKFQGDDFSNHGRDEEQLQIYGIVPANPNVRWEEHEDKDGVVRRYACCDVLVYTARFPEAEIIANGTGHSMELYDKSISGKWIYQDGQKFFKFEDGCFIGLCALGKNTEPCFEGAAFYEYNQDLQNILEELKRYNTNGGERQMNFKFKLSDSKKLEAIFNLINPGLAEGYIDCTVAEVYDDYALCYDYANHKYFRAYYSKDDVNNSVEITEQVDAFVLDVTQTEYEILQRINGLTNGDYSLLEQGFNAYQNMQAAQEVENEHEQETTEEGKEVGTEEKVEIAEEQIETELETETTEEENAQEETATEEAQENETDFAQQIADLQSQISELENKISTYKVENENLKEYQLNAENNKKLQFLQKYEVKLPAEIVEDFRNKLNNYSTDDFKAQVSAKVLENNEASIFSQQEFLASDYSQNDEVQAMSGAERLIANVIKKRNMNGGM